MTPGNNTLFLRLEGPLQAWGDNSKFVIRRCMDAPTKSGVLGLICCAMGLSRQAARDKLPPDPLWNAGAEDRNADSDAGSKEFTA